MFSTDVEDLFDGLVDAFGSDVADRIRELSRPALGFGIGSGNDTLSYLDGLPRMAADIPWPEIDGTPLPFRASIDLRDLPTIEDWPNQHREGLLLFFGWDYHETANGGRVVHVETHDFEPRPYPRSMTGADTAPEMASWGFPRATQPLEPLGLGICTPYLIPGIRMTEPGTDAMPHELLREDRALTLHLEGCHNSDCAFQLLGIAEAMQWNPLEGRPGWRLLGQIDTRDEFVMRFVIEESDLAGRNYERALGDAVC